MSVTGAASEADTSTGSVFATDVLASSGRAPVERKVLSSHNVESGIHRSGRFSSVPAISVAVSVGRSARTSKSTQPRSTSPAWARICCTGSAIEVSTASETVSSDSHESEPAARTAWTPNQPPAATTTTASAAAPQVTAGLNLRLLPL
ncbi:hypothetical protein [Rhodococcoides fascians]|uniref:hypothetical protein n=1 Tax=Nocardiaceae TaxID=85025 RepID=UPI0032119441